jgi:hypothetical protein
MNLTGFQGASVEFTKLRLFPRRLWKSSVLSGSLYDGITSLALKRPASKDFGAVLLIVLPREFTTPLRVSIIPTLTRFPAFRGIG